MGKSFKMSVEEVKAALIASGYSISGENRNGNNLATVLNLANGCIVNCWDSGKVNLQDGLPGLPIQKARVGSSQNLS